MVRDRYKVGRCNAEGCEGDEKTAEAEGGVNWSVEGCLNVAQFDTL